MNLKPLHDWTVIVPAEAATTTAGGLYIPDSAREKPEEGVVEAIGPGALEEKKTGKKKAGSSERMFVPTTLKPGDRVLFERWSGRTHRIGTEERILVRERDILGVLERPLQIPEATGSASSTAIATRHASVPARQAGGEKLLKTQVKPKAAKTAKKTAAKKAAPTAKKAANKAAGKTAKKSPAAGGAKAGTRKKAKKKK